MSRKRAVCPSCGAPVIFNIDNSLAKVCEHCHTVVARTDQKIEDIGKVAEIAESDSPLSLRLTGKFNGKSFELTGRAQIRHQLGGSWDEWYASFSNGKWGWLAEAQGRFFLTYERALPKVPPAFDALEVGQEVLRVRNTTSPSKFGFGDEMTAMPTPLVVAEKGTAEYIAAEGELPYRLEPGKKYGYADLSGVGGEFGTLDYSADPPKFFLGREVTLQELGISEALLKKGGGKEKRVQSAAVSCPHCGGSLTLKAPDKTERVVCPYCNSMLDANNGKLQYLKTLDYYKTPLIPLGKKAEFENYIVTVVGYMERSTVLEGERWTWDEYLLYHPAIGYRWLVFSDDEWWYVKPLNPGEVHETMLGARYADKNYYQTQKSAGRVESVVGEFYWKVQIGETVEMEDFKSGSQILSKESYSYGDGGGEVTWSYGTSISHRTVCQKFGLPYEQLSTGAGQIPSWVTTMIAILVVCVVIWILYEVASDPYFNTGSSSTYHSSGSSGSGGHSSWGGGGGFGGGK